MACGCNGGVPEQPAPQEKFVVRLPDGTTKVVEGEHNAKVEVTMAGSGASYSRQ